MTVIALLGDRNDRQTRWEINALRLQLADELGVHSVWVREDADLTAYDGVWIVPTGVCADPAVTEPLLAPLRERGVPHLVQPYRGALAGSPIGPLVLEFVESCRGAGEELTA